MVRTNRKLKCTTRSRNIRNEISDLSRTMENYNRSRETIKSYKRLVKKFLEWKNENCYTLGKITRR